MEMEVGDGEDGGQWARDGGFWAAGSLLAVGDEEEKKENERERKKWGVYIKGYGDIYKLPLTSY